MWSNTGSLEGAWFIASVNVSPWSEQQLVECDLVDSTCNSVFVDNGFAFGEENGLSTEASYSHTAPNFQTAAPVPVYVYVQPASMSQMVMTQPAYQSTVYGAHQEHHYVVALTTTKKMSGVTATWDLAARGSSRRRWMTSGRVKATELSS